MYNPVSTYRIQFNKNFTLKDFKESIGYILLLEPSSIYASPFFQASPGSMHGYDITNPLEINSEIGTYAEFRQISDELKSVNIGWIQDIVPNHMAYHMNNSWLMDVLENGLSSGYADFFDIDFSYPDLNGQIVIPFLGKNSDDALNDGEITLDWKVNNFIFRYFDYYFPFNFRSFHKIILKNLKHSPAGFKKIWQEYVSSDEVEENFLTTKWPELKNQIKKMSEQTAFKSYINSIVNTINADKIIISELLNLQNYQLRYWKDSSTKLNYRRFFTVNSLICLRMENDTVFDNYHTFIINQIRQKRFQGIRVDHIDGLQKTHYYLEKLRLLCGEDCYLIAEKILERDEYLNPAFPIQGTSGYDFLAIVNNLLAYKKNLGPLTKFYRKLSGITDDKDEIIYKKKKFILTWRMNGDWDNLCHLFNEAGFVQLNEEVTKENIRQAIGEFLILFPVYKLYSDCLPVSSQDALVMQDVFEKVLNKRPELEKPVAAIENVLLYQKGFDSIKKEKALSFFLRCMQFTGPLMAKGVEDTAMYFLNSFIGHNEVGDSPGAEGISVKEYHDRMIERQNNWPLSMNATSTHDTKRGEDVRARLNVISEIPEEWITKVRGWMKMNEKFRTSKTGTYAPTKNEEYFIYQTLTGIFPFNGKADSKFIERIREYLIKSMREAKTNTNWDKPNEEHEVAVVEFAMKILEHDSRFLKSFIPFQQKISNFGIINSLTQLMLKGTSPGVPDFYQGTELWDLSMVDPDNRRPVDYSLRMGIIEELLQRHTKEPQTLYDDLFSTRIDGRIKLWLTHLLMVERKTEPELFHHGNYIPLKIKGRHKDHVIAFARNYMNTWYIVAAPLFLAHIPDNEFKTEPGNVNWDDTRIILPDTAPNRWWSITGRNEMYFEEKIYLSDLMKINSPVLIKGIKTIPRRFAGVLAHVSSLPGKYGTGDLGPVAYKFVDFLRESGHSFWQILPFNPTSEKYSWSPYSSSSAFAGNPMFLSPDILFKKDLLIKGNILDEKFRESDRADFTKAIKFRSNLLKDAFKKFNDSSRPFQKKCFDDFCQSENFWLNDYALFVTLKKQFRNKPWDQWPADIRNRKKKTLSELLLRYKKEVEREKFCQYLFHKQWIELKKYSNNKGIRLIGDVSFYVNYDSAEVWAHPGNFKLDPEKKPISVAGVPPDYFSSDGQLWNMPVYNWDKMRSDGYQWWINRIKRNLDLCDIVRFDHFRGFSEYWEVPAGETTARNGKWIEGPGNSFFEEIKKEFPDMPFIAEDLGQIDDKVIKLRDDFQLPGMAVLQFAFGDSTPSSSYTPHNHVYNSVVYTGTHDNNTTKGWYSEISDQNKKEAEEYVGHKIHDNYSHDEFIRMAYSSVARIAIIPIQDILGLDVNARLNEPSTIDKNWLWKLRKTDIKKDLSGKLRRMAILFGRK